MKPVPHGEPCAGKLHVRFDEGAGVPTGRPALFYTLGFNMVYLTRKRQFLLILEGHYGKTL